MEVESVAFYLQSCKPPALGVFSFHVFHRNCDLSRNKIVLQFFRRRRCCCWWCSWSQRHDENGILTLFSQVDSVNGVLLVYLPMIQISILWRKCHQKVKEKKTKRSRKRERPTIISKMRRNKLRTIKWIGFEEGVDDAMKYLRK